MSEQNDIKIDFPAVYEGKRMLLPRVIWEGKWPNGWNELSPAQLQAAAKALHLFAPGSDDALVALIVSVLDMPDELARRLGPAALVKLLPEADWLNKGLYYGAPTIKSIGPMVAVKPFFADMTVGAYATLHGLHKKYQSIEDAAERDKLIRDMARLWFRLKGVARDGIMGRLSRWAVSLMIRYVSIDRLRPILLDFRHMVKFMHEQYFRDMPEGGGKVDWSETILQLSGPEFGTIKEVQQVKVPWMYKSLQVSHKMAAKHNK